MANVYVLDRTPGATETVAWESICQAKGPIVYVKHSPLRYLGRWGSVERKRQFIVYKSHSSFIRWREMSSHYTLEKALAAAHRVARLEKSS